MAEDNKPDEPLEMDPMEPANKADDAAVASLNFAEDDALREDVEEPTDLEDGAVAEPEEFDVISGRGASVNAHSGNKKFRALCFHRKAEFMAANHAGKRRIAKEIVQATIAQWGSRFLKRKKDKGPWYRMTDEQALLKACQVMRDHRRPDRVAQREAVGKKRNRAPVTPMDEVELPPPPVEPIQENPYGVHDHDVLCGRGAFVNGHVGNERLRRLAQERKAQFDAGNYTEKRGLATEIVTAIRSLDPPGRFLRRAKKTEQDGATWEDGEQPDGGAWEELSDDRAIHKCTQVMRDIDRADRKHREERRRLRVLKKEGKLPPDAETGKEDVEDSQDIAGSAAVEEAVAAAAEAMDKALEAASETGHVKLDAEPVAEHVV